MTDLRNYNPAWSTPLTAGGATVATLGAGTTPTICCGSGAPTMTAAKGSIYLRTDGSTVNDRAYINSDGGTTWQYITTAA